MPEIELPVFVASIQALVGDRYLGTQYPSSPISAPPQLIQNWKSLLGQ